MSTIILRPYQVEAIAQMRTLMQKGCKSILYTAPCGSGKTALTAHMLHTAASKGMRCLFVVHRRELIKQSQEAFNKEGLKHGVISAGFTEDRTQRVQLASVQTLARRYTRYPRPTLLVWDEAHHLAAGSWSKIFGHFESSYHIGLTATPQRLDGQGLGKFFKALALGPSVQTLIAAGYLSPYKLYAPTTVNLDGIHTRMGDYEKHELVQAMDKPTITGDAVAHYKRLCYGKRSVVFCASIAHSRHVVEKFKQEGFNAEHVDGETPSADRDRAVERFKDGNTQILSNVDLFGEGFNVPMAECAILLRPTQSLSIYLQAIGRVLRPGDGKTATILDHVGNCLRHGLPDEDRSWSLEGRLLSKRATEGSGQSVKICPSCFAAMEATYATCKFCGFTFEVKARKIDEKEGDLQEVVRGMQRKEQGRAQSMQDLYEIGKARGYKNPRAWAYYVFKGRQQKKLGRI